MIRLNRLIFLLILIIIPHATRAESWMLFTSNAVETSINTMVPNDYRQSTASEYEYQMDKTTGKISSSGILSVCIAAGWDVTTTDGFYYCRSFIENIAILSGVTSSAAAECKEQNGIRTISEAGTSSECIGRDGSVLVYSESCRGGQGECVDIFKNLRTQVPNAKSFIYQYGNLKDIKFTCSNEIVDIHKLGSDYIKCSAGGKAYEFRFDTLNQTYNQRMVNSENTALCEMFGGTVTGEDDVWLYCDLGQADCNKLEAFAVSVGHTIMYSGSCRLSRTINSAAKIFLNHIDGVNSYKFYELSSRTDNIKPQLEQYLKSIYPNEEKINCDNNVQILNDPTTLDTDWIITCTVGTQSVDFIFDNLSTSDDKKVASATAAMNCVIYGGEFVGRKCSNIPKDGCEKLDTFLKQNGSPNGCKYDENARACILSDVVAQARRDEAVGYIVGSVVIVAGVVAGVVAVIGTGGVAVPALIAGSEMILADSLFNFAIARNQDRLTNVAAKRFSDFISDANKCTDETCALNVLEKHYATLSRINNELTIEDLTAIDETLDKLFGMVQTEFVACGKDAAGNTIIASPADCAIQASNLRVVDYVDMAITPVLVIGSIAYNPGYVANRFINLKQASKTLSTLEKVMNVSGMSTTDRAFYTAYVKYGNRSQTFNEWKQMFDNDLNNMRKTVVNWPTWDDVRAGRSAGVAYDTYNPEVSNLNKTIQNTMAEVRTEVLNDMPLWRQIDEQVQAEFLNGSIKSVSDYNRRWQELAVQQGTSLEAFENAVQGEISRYLPNWVDQTTTIAPLENADFVIAERVDLYSRIVNNNPELRRMANNFSNLTDSEKIDFASAILNQSAKEIGIHAGGPSQVTAITSTPTKGYYITTTDAIELTTTTDLPTFMNLLAHEDAHRIDNFVPQAGMLGTQNAQFSGVIYTDKPELGYLYVPTERSSYAIGDAVGNQFIPEQTKLSGKLSVSAPSNDANIHTLNQ